MGGNTSLGKKNGNINVISDDEFGLSAAGDSLKTLKSLIPIQSDIQRNLLEDTSKIVEKNKTCKRKDELRKIVAEGLLFIGYDASVCKSHWEKSTSHPAGEYEYIDVIFEGGERVLVDIDFRSEFEMPRPTGNYKAILQSLPYIFVGEADRLRQILLIVCEAAKLSFKKKGMHLPPWRKFEYMKDKWLAAHTRSPPHMEILLEEYGLTEILSATTNFSNENLITEHALGKVYRGQLLRKGILMNFTIRRLDCKYVQEDEFKSEISMLTSLAHKNIASIYGHCDDNDEKITIYQQAFHGTLDQHLSDPSLTWSQRLQICVGVARGLNFIHYDVIHCDINSSKILLDEKWEPKIYGFELSTKYPQSWRHHLLFSRYSNTYNLTPKYDVYYFGVLMLEVLCGRKPVITNDGVEEEPDEIMDPNLRKQMDADSLRQFKDLAYKCLNQEPMLRPTMDQIVKELEEVLELHWKHANLVLKEHSIAADEGASSNCLEIPLSEIRRATNRFNKEYWIGCGGYADVYKAELDVLNIQSLSSTDGKSKDEPPKIRKTVAIKRIVNRPDEHGKQGFLTEIDLLTSCKHPNIVSLLGFSKEAGEMILVYEYAFKGSLSDYLASNDKTTTSLTWAQRLHICLDIAHGINYLHNDVEGKPRIIHRDIKSDNILLDENLNAKLADFGLSKSQPANQQFSTFLTKNIAGTEYYVDPEYLTTGKYKKESDIYSFGVVLFEVLSGRVAYDPVYTAEDNKGLAPIARRRYNEGTLKELIDPKIIEEDDGNVFTLNRGPNQDSFDTCSKIAYKCLAETQAKRPTSEVVIKELQEALNLQGETMALLKFRLNDIVSATENFAEKYCIGLDTTGMVYKAELDMCGNNNFLATERTDKGEPSTKLITVAIKRIIAGEKGKHGFFEELETHTSYKHPNVASLLGFCGEGDERILVYEHASNGSLDDYLKTVDNMDDFTWTHRLRICLEIAHGLFHFHTRIVNPQRVIHGDVKSANILLGKNGEVKIAYFGLSKLQPTNYHGVGMKVYEDPEYETTCKLERVSDVYSFGVVLLEIFCGRVAYDPVFISENDKGLASIAVQCINGGTTEKIIDPRLKEEIDRGANKDSLDTFLKIAYECLGEAVKRPTMEMVIKELEMALTSSLWSSDDVNPDGD